MNINQVGAQLFTLREQLKTPADIAKTLAEVSKIGYRNVQVSGMGPIDAKDLAVILEDNGLFCCSTHDPAIKILKETESVIEKLKVLGCPTTAIPSMPAEYRTADGYRRLAEEATAAGRLMRAAGIELMYHNHAFEFQKYGDKTGLELLYEYSDPQFLQAEIDTYWVQVGGGSPAGWCRKVKGRMPAVHFKDYLMTAEGPTMCEIGQGNLDFPGIARACEEGGVRWYLVEQDKCTRPPLESLAMSFTYIRDRLCA
jgi:sugar phosphate isomerase/epimerase